MNQNQEHIDEHILLQYLLGNASAEEQRTIEAWLNESKENRSHLDELESLWIETGRLSPPPVAVDVDSAWTRISERITQYDETEEGRKGSGRLKRLPLTRYLAGAAAMILLLFGIYVVFQWISKSKTMVEIVASDQIVRDTLPDGSLITLNKDSRLVIQQRFAQNRREMNLAGEAYFQVLHDPARPFVINCERAKIIVMGTSFNVNGYAGKETSVYVDEGMVFFCTIDEQNGDTAGIRLSTGMKGVLPEGSSVPETAIGASADELFWLDKRLVFRDTGLKDVFDKLRSKYNIIIKVSDTLIYNCRLTATFTSESPDQILQIIAETFDLTMIKEKENYLFRGNGCKAGDH